LVHSRQECEKLQIDNVELREHINNTRGSKPVHADDQYIKLIEHLNEKTKSWIAGLSKSGQAGDIQHEMGLVLEALGKTSHGRSVLETSGENTHVLAKILGDRRRRMALIRQLLWTEITESVIQPFAFGLTGDYNALLAKALAKMMHKGIRVVSVVTHSQKTASLMYSSPSNSVASSLRKQNPTKMPRRNECGKDHGISPSLVPTR
jgi:hypothetical protein